MKVKKAKPKKAVAKAVKAVKKNVKEKIKPKRKPSLGNLVFTSMVETLERTTLGDGEFDLPSILTRQLEKSHPDYALGLHRQYYIPLAGQVPYYLKGQTRLKDLMKNQATAIMPALIGEGIKLKGEEIEMPLCSECEAL